MPEHAHALERVEQRGDPFLLLAVAYLDGDLPHGRLAAE